MDGEEVIRPNLFLPDLLLKLVEDGVNQAVEGEMVDRVGQHA